MSSCNYDAPNGEKSLLYDQLEQNHGSDEATRLWMYLHSEEFGKKFLQGWKYDDLVQETKKDDPENWMDKLKTILDVAFGVHTDERGEPTYDWMKKNVGLTTKTEPTPAPKVSTRTGTPTTEGGIFGSARTKEKRMSFEDALKNIKNIFDEAHGNHTKEFDLTSIKATPANRASTSGFTPIEMATLFASLPIPSNVKFDTDFENLIKNTASYQLAHIDYSEAPLLTYDESILKKTEDTYKVPIRDEHGNKTGETFTAQQQVEAVDSIIYSIWSQVNNNPTILDPDSDVTVGSLLRPGEGTIFKLFGDLVKRYDNNIGTEHMTPEQVQARIQNLKNVRNSWNEFVERALYRLESYGLKVKRSFTNTDERSDDLTDPIQEEKGKTMEDYYDSSFERDPKDTASGRIKLFLASIQDAEVGLEREPKEIKLSISDPILRNRIVKGDELGKKNMTIRTAEQLKAAGMKHGNEYVTTIDDVKFRATVSPAFTERDLEDQSIQGNADEENIIPKVGDAAVKLEPWVPKTDKVQVKENFVGFAKLVNFDELFQELLEITSGVPNTYDAMTEAINNEVKNFRPTLAQVTRRLERADPQTRNEFVKVMSKQYQEFSIALFSRQRSGLLKMVSINANSGSAVNSIITQWRENQKHAGVITKDAEGNMVIDKNIANDLHTQLMQYSALIDQKKYPDVSSELKPFAKKILAANGILMPDSALDYFFLHTSQLTKNTGLAGSIHDQFTFTKDGQPRGVFSAITSKLAGITEESSVDEKEYLLNNNPLYTENTAMRILARLAYRFSDRIAAQSHMNSEGKTIYSYGLKTHLSNTVLALKNDDAFRARLESTFLGKHNWFLQKLRTGQVKDEFSLQYVDGLKNADRANNRGITRPDMSSREQLLFTLGQFQNGGYKTGNFISLTHSDKTTTPLFTGIPKFNLGVKGYAKETRDAIYNTFLGEYERVSDWHNQRTQDEKGNWKNPATKNDSYNKGGGLYYLMPWLNHDFMQEAVKSKRISQNDMNEIWNNDKTPAKLGPKAMPAIMKIFESEFATPETNRLFARMKEEGFIENKLLDERYMNKNLQNAGIVKLVYPEQKNLVVYHMRNADESAGTQLTEEQAMEQMMKHSSKDFLVNYFLFHTAMSGLAFGDPALTYKPGKRSAKDFQKVEDSMKEYQKRLAKDIAPGSDPTWDNGPQENYKTITLHDDERAHAVLEHIYGKDEINGSDAQELTTVREHLYVMKASGLISDKVYNEMADIIDEGLKREDKYYEFTKPEHKSIVMQIMKPVSVSHNFNEVPGLSTVQYVKSSSMPLYPPMTKYFQIDELRKVMEGKAGDPDSHIPRANFISAKKEGAPIGKGVKIFDNNGDIHVNPDSKEWADASQVLSRSGFRIQQDVPYDELKKEILTGSQDNKLFVQGIQNIKDFTVRGLDEPITGERLKEMKEDVRKEMIRSQLSDFSNRMGLDAKTGVANTERLVDMLAQEAQSRNYPPNDIVMLKRTVERVMADGTTTKELAIPLFFNSSSARFESLLMSLIKGIGKVYMPGKSYIQASSAGFKFKEKVNFEDMTKEQKAGIVWVTKPNSTDLIYDGKDLQTMQRGDKSSQPAQVLIPFNFLVKDGNGNDVKADIKDFMKIDEKGRQILDTEKVPHELLDLLGFRIPTQKHNSMLPIHVVGFIPDTMGDAIVVPAAITKQMGSDFDVDKLFSYRRPYNYNSKTKSFEATSQPRIMHQGMEAEESDNRDYDYWTDKEDEAKGYGPNVRSRAIDTSNYLIKHKDNGDWSPEFEKLHDEFVAQGHKTFDILDNGPEGLENQKAFFKFLEDKGYSGLAMKRMKSEENSYAVSFKGRGVKDATPSKDQLLSRYFDLHWAALTHPDMYDTVMSPLDKPDLKNEAQRADAVVANQMQPFFSIARQLDDFLSQKDAKVMVGISSLSVVFTAGVEDKNLRVEKTVVDQEEGENGKPTFKQVPNGVDFIPEGETTVTHAHMISGKGEGNYYQYKDGDELKMADVEVRATSSGLKQVLVDPFTNKVVGDLVDAVVAKRTKLDDLTSLQSEFLDHAKNRTIDRLNINLQTIHAALAMASLSDEAGKKPTLKHLALFLRQPVIQELVRRLSLSQDSISTSFVADAFNTTIADLHAEHLAKATVLDPTVGDKIQQDDDFLKQHGILDIKSLKEGLNAEKPDADWHLTQAGLIETFAHLSEIGKELASIQRILNQDPRGPGKNMISALDTISKRESIYNSFISDADQLFHTEQGFIHEAELDTAATAYSEVLPYSGLRPTFSTLQEHMGKKELSVQDQQDMVEHFKSYIFSSQELGLSHNSQLDRFRLLYGSHETGSLASRVWEAQNTWGKDNYFLNRLQPQQADIPNTPSYVFYRSSRASALDDQENTAALLELLTSKDEKQRRLGEDLVRYAYVTGGISGSFSFIRYVPADYLNALPFAAHLRTVNQGLQLPGDTTAHASFVHQWIQHNPQSMPKITLEALGRESLGERFQLPYITPELKSSPLSKLVRTEKGTNTQVYPDYLSYFDKEDRQWKLYVRRGSTEFTRIDTLGNSYFNEYASNSEAHVRSILPENRALIRQEGFGPELEHFMTDFNVASPKFDAGSKYKLEEGKTLQPFEISHLFKQIRDDKSVPKDQRILSKVLDDITYAIREVRPLSLEIQNEANEHAGSADNNGKMVINFGATGMSHSGEFARTLNHEAMHALTAPFSYTNDTMRSKFPEAAEAYDKVKEVHQEAKAAVVAEAEKLGYNEQVLQNALKGAAMPESMRDLVNLYYTVSNVDEFITSTLTKENLQKFMNERETTLDNKPKTLLGKLAAAFHDFITGLTKALGIHVKEGSLLKTAVERSFKFLETQENPEIEHFDNKKIADIIKDYTHGVDMTVEANVEQVASKITRDFDGLEAKVKEKPDGNFSIHIDSTKFNFNNLFNLDDTEKVVTNPIDKIYGKVQEQIQEIRASLAKPREGMDAGLLGRQRLLTELKTLAADLKAFQDMNKINDIATFQLDWAKKIADQYQMQGLNTSVNEVMTAHRLSSLWRDTIDLVYSGSKGTALDIDQNLAKIQSRAQEMNIRFTTDIMPSIMKSIAARGGVTLSDADFKGIEDMPMGEAKFLSLERAKSKLVQEVARTIQNTHRNYLEDSQRLIDRLSEFQKNAKNLASSRGMKLQDLYQSMFQSGTHWGLVDEYNSSFYKWKAGLKNRLVNRIDNINETVADSGTRAQMIRDAHKDYWKDLKKKARYIDSRILFDGEGEIRNTKPSNKMYHDLIDEYGQEKADKMIRDAQEKFKQYLDDKEAAFASYDSQVENSFMTAEEAAVAKGQWDLENSPLHKLSTQESVLDTRRVSAEKYLVFAPKKGATNMSGESFFDAHYQKIHSDPEMRKMYEEVKDMMDTFKGNLPFYLEDKLGPSFLPAIRNKVIGDISQVPAYIKSMPRKVLDSLTASENEEFQQSRVHKEIPITYINDPLSTLEDQKPGKGATKEQWDAYNKAKEETLKQYSKNLPKILEQFGMMSLHYKHFSEAKDAIDLGHEVLKKAHDDMSQGMQQVERNGKKVTVKGGLHNTLGTLEYAIDALMYKRTKDLEGKMGDLYLKADKEKIEKSVKDLKVEVEEYKRKYRNNEVSKEEYESAMQKINDQLDRYEVRKFYGSKVGDTLITWAQMKALSYNPLASINNVAFGLISAQIHSAGKEDFDGKAFRKAFSIMLNSTGKSLRLTKIAGNDSTMSKTARKVYAIMDKFGVMGEITDGASVKTNLEHREPGLKTTLSPYQMMRTGDYFCKGLNTIATMLYKTTMIDGKEVSLWDAFDENGKFKGKDEKWESADVTKQTEFHKLRNQVIGVNKIIMGNQDKSSPMWAKKSVLWRLVGQFRLSWFAEGIANRFESEREDIQLGRVKKGRYRTYADLGPMQSVQMILRQMLSAVPGTKIDPYKDATLKNGKAITETDKANMRRNLAELTWFLTIYGAVHTIAAMGDPSDDDAKKKKYKFAMNMLTRSYQDVALYSNPAVFDTILGTPAPALSTIKDTQNFIAASAKLMMKSDYTWDKWFQSLTRAGFIPQTTLYNKYKTMTSKDLSTLNR